MDLTLDLTAAKGRAGGVDFRDLKAVMRVTEKDIVIEPFGLGVFGGRLDAKAHVSLSSDTPELSIDGKVSGIDMAAVSAFAGQAQAITGRLGGTVQLTGAGADPSVALETARGKADFAITDGVMPNLHLVRAIILAFGKPAPQQSDAGDAFSRIAASTQLAGGVLQLSSLTFESPDVSLAGTGTLSLTASSVDVAGKAMLSEALTKQAGTDLVRFTAENNRVTVPVTVTGSIAAPKVGVNVGDIARRAATNEAKTQIKKQTDSLLNRFTGRKKP